jgi:hypothetical protein
MVDYMKRFLIKLRNYFKYGEFKVYESLGAFVTKYGNGGTYLSDYDKEKDEIIYVGTL